MEFLEQFHSFICGECRDRIYHGWKVRKSAAFRFLCPFRSISVAVEYDPLMIDRVFLDQIMDCHIKVLGSFQTVAGFFESLGCNRIQYDVAFRDRVSGAHHTEFELVSGKSER